MGQRDYQKPFSARPVSEPLPRAAAGGCLRDPTAVQARPVLRHLKRGSRVRQLGLPDHAVSVERMSSQVRCGHQRWEAAAIRVRSLGLRIGLVTVPRLSPTVIRLCTATAYGLPAREQRCRGHRAKSDGVVDGSSSCTECSTPSFGPARADPAITQRARDRQLPSGHPVLHCFCAVRGPVNYSSPRGRSNGVLSYITIRPRRSLSRHGGR